MKILLVEPDVVLANIYQKSLESSGHHVRVSATGQQAIDLMDHDIPDVIILEIQLAGHNGIEFLYEMRSYGEWLETPVIVLSNVPQSEFRDSHEVLIKYLKISQYLYKPATSLDKLLGVLESLETKTLEAKT